MTVLVLRGDARALPLPDESVDLIVTSPPYFALRSYTDGGEAYGGQIGSEPTPGEYIDNLIECTREWLRVLKPTGSLWVNLGDSYSGKPAGPQGKNGQRSDRASAGEPYRAAKWGTSADGDTAQWTQASAAWLAGVLDCEGSVSIRAFKTESGTTSFVAWMRVGMMDPQVCARIREITGVGRLFQDGRGVYNWHVASQQARYVLERIWPYLLIKQRQALGAIELCRHVADRRARGKWAQLTPEDIAYRLTITEAVQTWNKRQEHPWTPPVIEPISLPHTIGDAATKSLRGLPWRYALRCVDDLGLILRAEVIWAKPNGLPESVRDRVRRSHEVWFHMTRSARYFAAVDEIRTPHSQAWGPIDRIRGRRNVKPDGSPDGGMVERPNPLGALPGSVWTVATQPLKVPAELGVDHFAAFPMELPRRIILGWSPSGICTACGEGRRPVVERTAMVVRPSVRRQLAQANGNAQRTATGGTMLSPPTAVITGEACACPDTTAPTRPAIVLDPFGGTGTTATVAKALGRVGITVDRSADYCRLARWRTNDPGQLAAALEVERPPKQVDDQLDLFAEVVP